LTIVFLHLILDKRFSVLFLVLNKMRALNFQKVLFCYL
jgi:hypothetical protein